MSGLERTISPDRTDLGRNFNASGTQTQYSAVEARPGTSAYIRGLLQKEVAAAIRIAQKAFNGIDASNRSSMLQASGRLLLSGDEPRRAALLAQFYSDIASNPKSSQEPDFESQVSIYLQALICTPEFHKLVHMLKVDRDVAQGKSVSLCDVIDYLKAARSLLFSRNTAPSVA